MADEAVAQMKTCTKCGETKPLGEYWKDSAKKSGYCPACIIA